MVLENLTKGHWAVLSIISSAILLAIFASEYGSDGMTFENSTFAFAVAVTIVSGLFAVTILIRN